jgi:ABC-type bacteriocin/lantibiotic exporter with double-glycine peptidase domain
MRHGEPTLRQLYRWVWRSSGRQQVRLGLLTALVFPLSMLPLELQRRMVDDALGEGDLAWLLQLGAAYAGVILLHASLKYLRNVMQGRMVEHEIRRLRRRLVRQADDEEGDAGAGASVSMIASETERLGGFIGESLSFPLLQGGILLSVLGYMIWLEPLMALVVVALLAPSLLIAPPIQRVINRHAELRTRLLRQLADRLVVQDAPSRPDQRIQRIYQMRIRIVLWRYLIKGTNNLLGQLGPLAILLIGGWLVIDGEGTVGTVVAFLSGLERITDPARELLNFYRRLAQARVQFGLLEAAT